MQAPTFILYKNGEMVSKVVGAKPPDLQVSLFPFVYPSDTADLGLV